MGKALGVTSFVGISAESNSIYVYSGQGWATASLAPCGGAWRLDSIAAPTLKLGCSSVWRLKSLEPPNVEGIIATQSDKEK